ncbi:Variant-specific surface protein, partial [Giardia duodenalis]
VCRLGCALARLLLRIQGRISRLVGQIVAASQLWPIYSSNDVGLHRVKEWMLQHPCSQERRVQGGKRRGVHDV